MRAAARAGTADDFDAPFLELASGTWPSGQHAATWTEDGRLLLYDNRNETGGEELNSRTVAYDVDLGALTATQVFEFVVPKFTQSLGDVDELDNGNLLVTAGGPGSSGTSHLVEVTPDGGNVWEATVSERIYRSERIAWTDIPARAIEGIGGAVSNDDGADPSDSEEAETAAAIDITDALLTSTIADCAASAGQYFSMITAVNTGNDFTGELVIEANDDTCTMTSNPSNLGGPFAELTLGHDGTRMCPCPHSSRPTN